MVAVCKSRQRDGSAQQGQHRQPLAGLGGMDELAGGAEQLFGHQGHLFDRPAFAVEGVQCLRREGGGVASSQGSR